MTALSIINHSKVKVKTLNKLRIIIFKFLCHFRHVYARLSSAGIPPPHFLFFRSVIRIAKKRVRGNGSLHIKNLQKGEEAVINELTEAQKLQIREFVTNNCANYCSEYGCNLFECECVMFLKHFAGYDICPYFRSALLPQSPELQKIFLK